VGAYECLLNDVLGGVGVFYQESREPVGCVEMRQDEVLEAREVARRIRSGFEVGSATDRSPIPIVTRNRSAVLAAGVAHRNGNHEVVSGQVTIVTSAGL
jgi:hypothetical protein